MKVLVTGASGKLGMAFVELLLAKGYDVYVFRRTGWSCKHFHHMCVRNVSGYFGNVMLRVRPHLVFHFGAMTDVDACEKQRELAFNSNVKFTQEIVDNCEILEPQPKLIFISTIHVKSPVNYYSVTKLFAEKVIQESFLENWLIIRTDQLYGDSRKSKDFINWVITRVLEDKQVKVYKDWYNNPTYIPDLSKSILTFVKKDIRGIHDVTGPNHINRLVWAKLIAKKLVGCADSKIVGIKSKRTVAKRANVKASLSKTYKILGRRTVSVSKGLELIS